MRRTMGGEGKLGEEKMRRRQPSNKDRQVRSGQDEFSQIDGWGGCKS